MLSASPVYREETDQHTDESKRISEPYIMRVSEILNTNFVSVEPEESASAAWARMRRENTRHLVVITKRGQIRGVISEGDLGDSAAWHGRTVEDLMTPDVHVDSKTSLRDAADVLLQHRIGCLPVVDHDRVVGIVTATDVFDLLARDSVRSPLPGWIPKPLKRVAGKKVTSVVPAHIRVLGTHLTTATRARIRRKLGTKLGKFGGNIERVSVRVKDVNGPKGGIDQLCRIKVVLSGLPSVVFEAQNSSADAAVEAALIGVERAVKQSLQRRRTKPMKKRPASLAGGA